ncbi:unnamed protein product [Rhodiola kirilowii]
MQLPDDVEGYGQAFVVFEEQKLDWADMFYMITLLVSMRKPPPPHLLPKLPPSLREAIEEYSLELKSLSMKLLEFLSMALKMDSEEFKDMFEEGIQSMRFNYYPPCPQPDLAIGITPHSDPDGFTILLQINDKEGLEIRKDGKWVSVKPISNAFVVNIGDVLEVASCLSPFSTRTCSLGHANSAHMMLNSRGNLINSLGRVKKYDDVELCPFSEYLQPLVYLWCKS